MMVALIAASITPGGQAQLIANLKNFVNNIPTFYSTNNNPSFAVQNGSAFPFNINPQQNQRSDNVPMRDCPYMESGTISMPPCQQAPAFSAPAGTTHKPTIWD
jgi:hypothetical protein